MGQQQLLLIVLGVIIVGIAVVVGINVFTASSMNANRDAVIADMTTLAAMSQQHYRKPGAMGGGGNSFDGSSPGNNTAWTVPPSLASTANGSYTATVGAQEVEIEGIGTEIGNDGTDSVTVTMTVGRNSITETVIDN